MKRSRRKYKSVLIIIAALVLLILGSIYAFYHFPRRLPEEQVTLSIPAGSSLQAITDSLYNRGVIGDKDFFQFLVQARGLETSLQAGVFKIRPKSSYQHLLYVLTHSRPQVIEVTVIEGLRAREIAREMAHHFQFDSTEFMLLVKDSIFTAELGVPGNSLEGFLFPDTYKFFTNENARSVIRKMVNQFFTEIPDSFYIRASAMGWNLKKVVTLASIIEGEAVRDSERGKISSVYHNRLDRGMRLQADPTIQYIIKGAPRRLLNKDLAIQSPYNTYLHRGLPPGPINNPGFGSIKAALYPAHTKYLYFVARGDGFHTFSRTNREHIQAKQHLQQLRREVYLERKRARRENSL
ncbi:MAG: endolytic transglycosylase MltG [Calditrichota bacterium]